MDWLPAAPRLWARILGPVLLVAAAAAVRAEFLLSLGTAHAFLTFYPAVMVAALYGGLLSGALATVGSGVLLATWSRQGAVDLAGWGALLVFGVACLSFSAVCEAMLRARARLRSANEKLREDIARRQQAEDALRDSEERFRRIFEESPIGLALVGPDLAFRAVNRAFRAFTGYSDEELRSMTFRDITHPDHVAADVEKVSALLRGEVAGYRVEKRYVRKGGSVTWGSVNVSALRDRAGSVVQLIAMVEDVDDRKRAEETVRALNAELEERISVRTADLQSAVHEMEAFSYAVAHDLRAPIRAIDGFAAMLEREQGGMLDGEGRRRLSAVRTNAHRMGVLIDDLLHFSRTSRTEMSWRPVDVARLAREVLAESVPAGRGEHVLATVADLPGTGGDAPLLRVAIKNLVSNAVKFSRSRDPAVIEIGFQPGPDGPVYFVRDNGVGFDQKYAEKIFEVFQKLPGSGEETGTGIGLAVARRIIERHGGRLWAEGESGRGATFWFTLGRAPRGGSGPIHLSTETAVLSPKRG